LQRYDNICNKLVKSYLYIRKNPISVRYFLYSYLFYQIFNFSKMKTNLFSLCALVMFCAFLPTISSAQLYSNGERLTTQLAEKWGAASAWEGNYRYAFTYITPTNIQVSEERWDGFSWNASGKIAVTLNANYSFNALVWQKWDGAQAAWRNKERSTYTYFNNDPTKTLVYKYDTANIVNNAVWDDNRRTTYTYNPNGLELQQLQEQKNSNAWRGDYKTNYTYNANSLMTSKVRRSWDITGGFWGYVNKSIFYYNANNLVSLQIDSSASNSTSPFTAGIKTQYLYNPNNLLAQELTTFYNLGANTWDTYVTIKRANTYNAQNLKTQETQESYDSNLGSLRLNSKHTYAYNAQNLRSQQSYESYDSDLGILTLKSTETNTYNSANNGLVYTYISQTSPNSSYRITNIWGAFVNTENTTPTFEFSVFPNPSADQINISLPENAGVTAAMIMSANGQFVKAQNLTNTSSAIDVQDLPAGSYQLILLQNGKSAVKTFVKQ
jgi:Secretion system C-terminal sorting domain